MTFDFKDFKTLLMETGITVQEAAKIFRTTRPTIYHWLKGTGPNQEVLLQFALRQIGVIKKALAAGDLPLSVDVESTDRLACVYGVMRKHL